MRLLIGLTSLLALAGCPRDPQNIDRDGDGFSELEDCDDENDQVFPLRSEVPYDGLDNDCDPSTPDDDLDGDGLGPPADCNDDDPEVRPGIPERPYDGIDQDCDESTPDDDLDGDGFGGTEDCNDNAPGIFPGNTEIYYDGIDNDCDELTTPDDDQDRDGVPEGVDCDDLDGLVRDGLLFHVDCDEDGLAASTDGAVQACVVPADPPTECGATGGWTIVAPMGPAFDPNNTTVDCADDNAEVFPGQLGWFETLTTTLPPGSTYDYDCSGDNEPEFGTYTCVVQPGTLPGTTVCVFTDGYDVDASCGVVANYQQGCVETSPTTCEPQTQTPEVRACH